MYKLWLYLILSKATNYNKRVLRLQNCILDIFLRIYQSILHQYLLLYNERWSKSDVTSPNVTRLHPHSDKVSLFLEPRTPEQFFISSTVKWAYKSHLRLQLQISHLLSSQTTFRVIIIIRLLTYQSENTHAIEGTEIVIQFCELVLHYL